jgi:hypothetical protein
MAFGESVGYFEPESADDSPRISLGLPSIVADPPRLSKRGHSLRKTRFCILPDVGYNTHYRFRPPLRREVGGGI